MGQAVSCLNGLTTSGIRSKVESGDCTAVLERVRASPGLLVAACFPGNNTIFHLVARYGQTAILTGLLQLVDELTLAVVDVLPQQPPEAPSRPATTEQQWIQRPGRQHNLRNSMRRGDQQGTQPQPLDPDNRAQQGDTHARPSIQRISTDSVSRARQTLDSAISDELAQANQQKVQPLERGKRLNWVQGLGQGRGCGPDFSHLDGLPTKRQLVNMVNARRQSPLLIAASRGHTDVTQILLQLGADPHTTDKSDGCTALHYAAMYGHVECARVLLTSVGSMSAPGAATPRIITISRDSEGTPRTPSTTQRPIRAIPRLVGLTSHAGATALHFAADAGHLELVKLLCMHGADINAVMRPDRFRWLMLHHGATPLHLAAEQGHLPVALALLRHYQDNHATQPNMADPRNAQDRAGLRPHQLAFLTHHFRVALVIRPGYPLRWLFDTPTVKTAIPSLASLAATALRRHLCAEIDSMEQAAGAMHPQQPHVSALPSGKPPLSGGTGSGRIHHHTGAGIRSSGMGLGMGMEMGSTMNTPRHNAWSRSASGAQAAAGGEGSAMGTPTAAGLAVGLEAAFRVIASNPEADPQSIREAAGLVPGLTTVPSVASPGVIGQTVAVTQAQTSARASSVPPLRLSAAAPSTITTADSIQTVRGIELDVVRELVPSLHSDTHDPMPGGLPVAPTRAAQPGLSSTLSLSVQPGSGSHHALAQPQSLRATISGPARFGAEVQGASDGFSISSKALLSRQVEEADENVCDVCFEEGQRLRLRPCCHEICLKCARKVCNAMVAAPALCPFCRGGISGFKSSMGSVKVGTDSGPAYAPNSILPC